MAQPALTGSRLAHARPRGIDPADPNRIGQCGCHLFAALLWEGPIAPQALAFKAALAADVPDAQVPTLVPKEQLRTGAVPAQSGESRPVRAIDDACHGAAARVQHLRGAVVRRGDQHTLTRHQQQPSDAQRVHPRLLPPAAEAHCTAGRAVHGDVSLLVAHVERLLLAVERERVDPAADVSQDLHLTKPRVQHHCAGRIGAPDADSRVCRAGD
mmetsp:Transcript_48703/g.161344  ORF Transcript_48703/g.161344 Transcript_48703/m.161344 type:complete len:213 (-) Transcript_48703:445-1083(-)